MVTMEALHAASDLASLDAQLLPSRSVVRDWASVTVNTEQAEAMHRGLSVPFTAAPGWVAMDHVEGGFLGLGEVLADQFGAGRLQPRRWFGLPGI